MFFWGGGGMKTYSDNSVDSGVAVSVSVVCLIAAGLIIDSVDTNQAMLISDIEQAGGIVCFIQQRTESGDYRLNHDAVNRDGAIDFILLAGDTVPEHVLLHISRLKSLSRLVVSRSVSLQTEMGVIRDSLPELSIIVQWQPQHSPAQQVHTPVELHALTTAHCLVLIQHRSGVASAAAMTAFCRASYDWSRMQGSGPVAFAVANVYDSVGSAIQTLANRRYVADGTILWVANGKVLGEAEFPVFINNGDKSDPSVILARTSDFFSTK